MAWQDALAEAGASPPLAPPSAGEVVTDDEVPPRRVERLERQLAEMAHAITRMQWDLAGLKAHPALRPIEPPEPTQGKPVCHICKCWLDDGAKRHCVIAGCPAKCES